MSYQVRSNRNKTYRHFSSTSYSQRRNTRGNNHGQKKYIDPVRFVQPATVKQAEIYTPVHSSFDEFALDAGLLINLRSKGISRPSPIQDQAIPAALSGQDIIGIAGTGTGKTMVFALPILQRLYKNPGHRALIVAPTRELAEQIEHEFKALGRGLGLFSVLLIGGTNIGQQIRGLKQGNRIVIGTPGRIKDHMQRRTLRLQNFNVAVLDEVDRMLDMGFIRDVTDILDNMTEQHQSMFFSATMEPKVRKLIDNFSKEPHIVSIKASSASENVNQDIVRYNAGADKIEKLHDLLIDGQVTKAIVFDETQRSVEKLVNELSSRGFSAGSIHGGKTQGQRKRALASFKNNDISILVATDVAARGIDVADITHVINYTTPNNYEDYIHRIGRAGRAGQTGYALTFIPA
jgi:ATP-dependent RNA helicase RhlE